MQNIERFNLYTAQILATLYEAFPVGKQLQASEIVQAMKSVVPYADEKEQRDLNGFVGQTLLWLSESGYVLQRGGTSPFRYVLSTKGLNLLNVMPTPVLGKKSSSEEKQEGEKSVGEKLIEATKDIGSDAGKEAKKQVLTRIVGEVLGHAARVFSGG